MKIRDNILSEYLEVVMKKSGTYCFPLGAVLLLVAYFIGVFSSILNNVAFTLISHRTIAQFLSSSVNIWSLLCCVIYILIVVFAFIKKPKLTVIPLGIFAVVGLISGVGSGFVNIINSIANNYFSVFILLSSLILILTSIINALIYLLLTLMAVDCFGKASKPIFSRFWFLPAIIFIVIFLVEIVSGLTKGFGFIEMIEYNPGYILFLLTPIISILGYAVRAVALFFLGKGFSDAAKTIYEEKNTESIKESDII